MRERMSESLSLSFTGWSLHVTIALLSLSLSLSLCFSSQNGHARENWLISFYFPRCRLSLAMVLVTAITSTGYAMEMQAFALDETRANRHAVSEVKSLTLSLSPRCDYSRHSYLHFRLHERARVLLCAMSDFTFPSISPSSSVNHFSQRRAFLILHSLSFSKPLKSHIQVTCV